MLSRRDEFAKAALQGAMANPHNGERYQDKVIADVLSAADAILAALGDDPVFDEGQDDDEYSKLRIDHDKMFDEVVRLRAEMGGGQEVTTNDLLLSKNAEISRLRAAFDKSNGALTLAKERIVELHDKLARYTSDLTDEQCQSVLRISTIPFCGPATVRANDAAIRRVRGGE